MAVSRYPFLKPNLVFHVGAVLLLLHWSVKVSPSSDLECLTAFKATSASSSNSLADWNATSTPCSWRGVSCTQAGRVSRLVLESLDLAGSFESLAGLTQLRVLSLKRNRLSGPVPDLSNLTSLKLLFLSHNFFSGEFPGSVTSLTRLYRLDLSHNGLSGSLPVELNRLTHLLTLRLESNRFTGPISGLSLPNLQDFNVSGNTLSGQIPKTLLGFPESAFSQNPDLCGSPTRNCSEQPRIPPDPAKPGSSDGAMASPLVNPSSNPTMIASSPSFIPVNSNLPGAKKAPGPSPGRARISTMALIAIVLGDAMVIVVIALLLYCYYSARFSKKPRKSKLMETEKIVYSSASPYVTGAASQERGRMVFFEGVRQFELEDLLRASAEMLGKGGMGTAYKAVLEDGSVVAVKRLREANFGGGGRREFEQLMDVLGRMRNHNLVSLRAYYFARDEKLLVYDYMPNGTLFWLLHGNRGPGRTPLDWTTRLRIAAGAARGLAFIHSSTKSLKLIHGNIKSTNILLDNIGNACISDFGLSNFSSSSAAAPRSNGYRAPESTDGRKLTQKSDVFSFGVLLLEILTGKCPSVVVESGGSGTGYGGGVVDLPRWVQSVVREEWTAEVFDLELMRYKDIEEEMVALLQIAMVCTSAAPEQRPKMSHVVKMIEEIRGVDVSPSHDSVSESPSVSEDTCGVSQ